jgi:hypothetical protein
MDKDVSWILYPYCKDYSQNLEHEVAKVVLTGFSVGLYNLD